MTSKKASDRLEKLLNPTPDDLARDLLTDLELCEAATPGPWYGYTLPASPTLGEEFGQVVGPRIVHRDHMEGFDPRDAAFIAATREGWPAAIRLAMAAQAEVDRLRATIRQHMNERGDDRCHADDGRLYAVLPEGDTRPERETLVTIENCQRYIECRQTGCEYVSPQRRIEELEAEVRSLRAIVDGIKE